mmetsp:Transcript_11737/g.20153  ORF Transcript_11737/g.20153 Transcript_11737/m.20153 type:complete len:265 (+) Transcript_11737:113-907(+)
MGPIRKLAIIGGTSLLSSEYFTSFYIEKIETEFGNVLISTNASHTVYFLQRHHANMDSEDECKAENGKYMYGRYRPPHLINHKANMQALKQLGVDAIVAVCCVGSVNKLIHVSTIVVPDDYFNLFAGAVTMFDDGRGHIVPGMSKELRHNILHVLDKNKSVIPNVVKDSGVYLQTIGPRFETPVESRFLGMIGGDVVGMTAASEAALAGELGIPYAMFCMVDNYANGISDVALSEQEFKSNVKKNQETVELAVSLIIPALLESS